MCACDTHRRQQLRLEAVPELSWFQQGPECGRSNPVSVLRKEECQSYPHGGVDGRPDSLEAETHLSRCWTGPAHSSSSSTRLAAAMAVRRRAATCQTFGGMPFRASAAQVNSVLSERCWRARTADDGYSNPSRKAGKSFLRLGAGQTLHPWNLSSDVSWACHKTQPPLLSQAGRNSVRCLILRAKV